MIYTKTSNCRICASTKLVSILELGDQYLTGIFPKPDEKIEKGPLELVKCDDCHLVQLGHSYDLGHLYGETYGYRSGLNASMVEHLRTKVEYISNKVDLKDGDLIVDIGSNDGTTLGHYKNRNMIFLGVDPSGAKFKKYYKPDVQLVPDFFSKGAVRSIIPEKMAKVVTSIAMFYDLENPIKFAQEIGSILHPEGVWVFEQSYLPLMIDTLAYDTVCHEHLEYYGLHQIQHILNAAGLKVVDVEFNDINGGSFSITAALKSSPLPSAQERIDSSLVKEKQQGYLGLDLFKSYAVKVAQHRIDLKKFINEINEKGQKIHAYGASTKGNVILQYCQLDKTQLQAVAEVNEDKFGRVTPGTQIPIISEKDSKAMKPDYFLVLPWHFKTNILKREKNYILEQDGKFIFPLPHIHVVDKSNYHQFV